MTNKDDEDSRLPTTHQVKLGMASAYSNATSGWLKSKYPGWCHYRCPRNKSCTFRRQSVAPVDRPAHP